MLNALRWLWFLYIGWSGALCLWGALWLLLWLLTR
jgi:hypothetical protein